MLFNSIEFILFFPTVVVFYFLLPHRFRWALLLLASYYFYMCWKVEYVLLIIASTAVDYIAGLQIGKAKTVPRRRLFLVLSLVVNLGLLFFFKYFNFFSDSARSVFNAFNIFYGSPTFKFLLPVGISFYTFQTLSYTIDVYRGVKEPERHLGIFALYVAFFPQLVAGPIERSRRLLPQFFEKKEFDPTRVTRGLLLMLWGYFQKLVIADRAAMLVDAVYADPSLQSGLSLFLGTYFFAFQIFCDFAGYSNIAIGAAQVMGYELMLNFKRPYFSKSIGEFWKRWHISLSSWFRDYLYVPLGGSRVSPLRWQMNVMAVFLISGLWHGAAWTFVVWGALHGFYFLFSHWTAPIRAAVNRATGLERAPILHKWVRVFITFHLVWLGWIFFRADSVGDAVLILSRLFEGWSWAGLFQLPLTPYDLAVAIGAIGFMEVIHLKQRSGSVRDWLAAHPPLFRWTVYYGMVLVILFFGVFSGQQFIYFQF